MSKLYVVPVLLALLALMVVPAMAAEDTASVELTIDPYCTISFNDPDPVTISITLSAPDWAAHNGANFTASANFNATVTAAITADPDVGSLTAAVITGGIVTAGSSPVAGRCVVYGTANFPGDVAGMTSGEVTITIG